MLVKQPSLSKVMPKLESPLTKVCVGRGEAEKCMMSGPTELLK